MSQFLCKVVSIVNSWASKFRQTREPEALEQARQEWLTAQIYYNSVSDVDLIDHAVYMLQAAEKKYTYLLKRAREKNLS